MKKALLLAALCVPALSMAELVGYYDFNNSLNPTFAGNSNVQPLINVFGGGNPTISGDPTFISEVVGATTKQVAEMPKDGGFFVNHGLPSNGGGAYGNIFSIMFDVKTRANTDEYFSFFNTNHVNTNDGDMFARKTPGGEGIGISGQYAGGWSDDTWTRVIVTFDLTQAAADRMRIYKDGVLVSSPSISGGVDGRWALYTTGPDGFTDRDMMYLFSDNDGDTMPYNVSSVAWWDTALTATEVADLGAVGQALTFPTLNKITGTLNLLDTADDGIAGSEDINWTLTDGTYSTTGTASVDDFGGGAFSIIVPASAPAGNYTLKFKGGTFLASTANVTLNGSDIALGSISLLNGDIDQDAEVGPGDFEAVVAQFGGPGDADVDNDGEVGPSDFEIIVANFGLGDN
jgi:hypothetical protein